MNQKQHLHLVIQNQNQLGCLAPAMQVVAFAVLIALGQVDAGPVQSAVQAARVKQTLAAAGPASQNAQDEVTALFSAPATQQ